MDADSRRKFQLVLLVAFVLAGARTLWIFHERNTSSMPEKPTVKERNEDDYVYLRPSHAHDLASSRAALKGNTVWVKAGNAVAYYPYAGGVVGKKQAGLLPPIAALAVKDVVMSGDQMMVVFNFNSPPAPSTPGTSTEDVLTLAAPIGVVRHGDATIVIDDIFFLSDPHKLYNHWSKDTWASVERHEITQGMSEMQAQAAMGVGHAPESGEGGGDYGNRTLVFTDPAHADEPVTVRFVDNAAVSVSH